MKPGQEACLRMAHYQYGCRNDLMMWRWLLSWATWDDGVDCMSEPAVKAAKKSRRRWKHLTNTETQAIIQKIPNWTTDHLNTYIFKMLVEDKLKEKNG